MELVTVTFPSTLGTVDSTPGGGGVEGCLVPMKLEWFDDYNHMSEQAVHSHNILDKHLASKNRMSPTEPLTFS